MPFRWVEGRWGKRKEFGVEKCAGYTGTEYRNEAGEEVELARGESPSLRVLLKRAVSSVLVREDSKCWISFFLFNFSHRANPSHSGCTSSLGAQSNTPGTALYKKKKRLSQCLFDIFAIVYFSTRRYSSPRTTTLVVVEPPFETALNCNENVVASPKPRDQQVATPAAAHLPRVLRLLDLVTSRKLSSTQTQETATAMSPSDPPTSIRNNATEPQAGKGFDFGKGGLAALTKAPTFETVEAERAWLKERLVAAIRIFANEGFDHTVVSARFVSTWARGSGADAGLRDAGGPSHRS